LGFRGGGICTEEEIKDRLITYLSGNKKDNSFKKIVLGEVIIE